MALSMVERISWTFSDPSLRYAPVLSAQERSDIILSAAALLTMANGAVLMCFLTVHYNIFAAKK